MGTAEWVVHESHRVWDPGPLSSRVVLGRWSQIVQLNIVPLLAVSEGHDVCFAILCGTNSTFDVLAKVDDHIHNAPIVARGGHVEGIGSGGLISLC
jgi:hypothetical protein